MMNIIREILRSKNTVFLVILSTCSLETSSRYEHTRVDAKYVILNHKLSQPTMDTHCVESY